jgi:hypothetical protein
MLSHLKAHFQDFFLCHYASMIGAFPFALFTFLGYYSPNLENNDFETLFSLPKYNSQKITIVKVPQSHDDMYTTYFLTRVSHYSYAHLNFCAPKLLCSHLMLHRV